jgi:hypothetical protein
MTFAIGRCLQRPAEALGQLAGMRPASAALGKEVASCDG